MKKEANTQKNKNLKLSILLSLILSLSIIILILFFTVDEETIRKLSTSNIKYQFFLAAVILNILYWILWGSRLKILSDSVDKSINIGLITSIKIVITNLFLGAITPSMAGGEPVRIYLLKKEGLSSGSATASVIGERLLDALFFLAGVPFAFLIYRDIINEPWLEKALLVGIFIFIIGIILFFYTLKYPQKTGSVLISINKKIGKLIKREKKAEDLAIRINREMENFHESMVYFLKEGRKYFIESFILTILFWTTGFMIPPMLLMGLGLEPFFIEACAAQILLIVIVMMPTTPGSAGVTEGAAAVLYTPLIGKSLIGVFILLFRFVTYYMNLIAGAIFQHKIFKSLTSFSKDLIQKNTEKKVDEE